MPDQFLTDYLSSIFGKEMLALTAISGYLILLSYFYGPDKWKKEFSDFDKFAFALMIGLTIYCFFAIPMAHFFIFLSAPEGYFTVDPAFLNKIIFFIIFSILIVGWMRIRLNEPLFGNKDAFSVLVYTFSVVLIAFSLIDLLLRLFLSGVYSDYAPYHSSQLTNVWINPLHVLALITMLLLLFSILHRCESTKWIKERLNQLYNSKIKLIIAILVCLALLCLVVLDSTNDCINIIYISASVIILLSLVTMLLLLFSILHGYEPAKCIKEILNQLCSSKVKCTIVTIVIIFLLLFKPIGTIVSPSIEEGEISINSYMLEPFCVDMTNKNFKGQAEVERTYNISAKLISKIPILDRWVPIEVNGWYLFNWDDVPGSESERLLRYLLNDHGIGWVESAEIRKSNNGKTIHIFKDKNWLFGNSREIDLHDKSSK